MNGPLDVFLEGLIETRFSSISNIRPFKILQHFDMTLLFLTVIFVAIWTIMKYSEYPEHISQLASTKY